MSNESNHLIEERTQRLETLQENGFNFPNNFSISHRISDIVKHFDGIDREAIQENTIQCSVAGRILSQRRQGRVIFIDLRDGSGQIQLFVSRNDVGDDVFQAIREGQLGDIVGVSGYVFRTQRGELSIFVEHFELLNAPVRPMPDNYYGLQDREQCYRQRYLDLMVNEDTRNRFELRSQIIQAIRNYFIQHRFLEVDTNLLQSVASGANARLFETHMDSLGLPLSLRVAPELALKRLVVGGFDRVFEIGKNFRNEGLSTRHNPEFTMIEFYQAYAHYGHLMEQIQQLMLHICRDVFPDRDTFQVDEHCICAESFATIQTFRMSEAIADYFDIEHDRVMDYDQLNAFVVDNDINIQEDSLGRLQVALFETFVESTLIEPTFITHYPVEASPLARRFDDEPDYTERFELFVAGREIANGFSELNDSQEQRERFEQQQQAKANGDDEAMAFDEDYIVALEHGLPPTAGAGIGIDRLVMLLTNASSIRDVILFPQLRN